jgi:hypothetical protein
VEAPGSYRISGSALLALRAHVIEQADAAEADLAERLLGQLASLYAHSQRVDPGSLLTFRPPPATAALAARALAALRAAEPDSHIHAAA